MRSRTCIKAVLGLGLAWGTWAGAQQPLAVQPSPAYYRTQPAAVPAAAPAVTAPAAAPVPAAQPVAAPPRASAQPALTLAPPPAVPETFEEEEGIYWMWGDKWPGLALGPKIGTTGIGLDFVFGINRHFNLRSGFNYGSLSFNEKWGSVQYDTSVDMINIPLLVDWYPGGGNFRISAGAYIQPDSKADIDATPTEAKQIGNHTYAPEIIGTLSGNIEVEQVITPYLGIGFGNTVAEDQWLTFTLDIGVIFQSYDVSLTADGEGMTTPVDTFRQDLVKEEQKIQDDIDQLKVFPVVTLGLGIHF